MIRKLKKNDEYSISIKGLGKKRHFRVSIVNDTFCIADKKFESMKKLIEYYTWYEL